MFSFFPWKYRNADVAPLDYLKSMRYRVPKVHAYVFVYSMSVELLNTIRNTNERVYFVQLKNYVNRIPCLLDTFFVRNRQKNENLKTKVHLASPTHFLPLLISRIVNLTCTTHTYLARVYLYLFDPLVSSVWRAGTEVNIFRYKRG